MTRFLSSALFCFALLFISGTIGYCSIFDEQLWEKYAEIQTSSNISRGSLAGVYLVPQQFGDISGKTPFADLRIVTDRKEEVAWQIVARRPEKQPEEIPHQMRNLSLTEKGETWLELLIEKQGAKVNAVDIVTPNTDFSRQVQVLGSPDGKNWNIIRKDGIIFDFPRREMLRSTHITFPQTNFHYMALKINNADAQPLTINAVKVLQENVVQEQTYAITGTVQKSELNAPRQENSVIVRMNNVFPLDRLIIATTERNFQRTVEVQIKRGNGEWEGWAQGTIFNFDTATMREAKLAIDIPEIATKEFRLIFKNLDSPPLFVINVTGKGYRRLLVFKQQSDQKLYLFWGNPLAEQPQYDLAGIISKQNLDGLPMAYLGQAHANVKFVGNNARLPFTERYKYVLYILVLLGIAGLVFLQYRVFRQLKQ